ncbi:MAG TPA: heavy metal-associated domain-containing protein, partial [Acidimicrobiales bacterium]|nr:heavy metal-associated domain-containing protein [Acidimicrobiales bacterium]
MTAVTGLLGTHFWHLLMLVATWIVGYWFIKRHFRKSISESTADVLDGSQARKEIELAVKGMTCASCAARIAKALNSL